MGTSRGSASLLAMSRDSHRTEAAPAREGQTLGRKSNSVWTSLPIVFSAGAIGVLLFLLLSPTFKGAEPVRARSARPGAETAVTQERGPLIERQKDKSL
jgi:hypothetical protein